MLSSKNDKFLRSMQPFFQIWYLDDIIGEGSSGTVYKITDNAGNDCALKVIPITLDDGTNTLATKELDPAFVEAYLEEMTNEILSEVNVMQKLRHNAGIVSYHEYDIIKTPDSSARFLLIKMDLLKPLNKVLRMRDLEFSKKEVAAMGADLLASLSECRKHNIIHRDIKPSNIFVTEDNRYLLGDFGSARLLEKTMMASHKGTLAYMAPEIAAGQTFNSTVDIYSLGIMMYQLLNNRRLPLLNDAFQFADIESAIEKRLSGISLPCPENADRELGKIVCKMCAYSPKDRYTSPEKCLKDLKSYLATGKTGSPFKQKIKLPAICMLVFTLILSTVIALTKNPGTKNHSATGISSGNVNSSGAIASDDKYLYYSQDLPNERGIRVSKNGKQKVVLCDYIMHDINLTENYLVFASRYTFVNTSKGASPACVTGLYRMRKDGSDFTCLDDSTVYNPIVYNESIYYLKNAGDTNILCRIPLEGGNTEILSEFDSHTYNFYPYEEQLYIFDKAANQLVALDINDKTKTVIINEPLISFCIEDGFLYYSPPGSKGFHNEIYVHKINSSTPAAIRSNDSEIITFPYGIYEFNVSNGVIYASSNITASSNGLDGQDGIWRVNRDGSDFRQIYTGNAKQLQITDQTLYFEDNSLLYYMDLDGTDIHEFEDITILYTLD